MTKGPPKAILELRSESGSQKYYLKVKEFGLGYTVDLSDTATKQFLGRFQEISANCLVHLDIEGINDNAAYQILFGGKSRGLLNASQLRVDVQRSKIAIDFASGGFIYSSESSSKLRSYRNGFGEHKSEISAYYIIDNNFSNSYSRYNACRSIVDEVPGMKIQKQSISNGKIAISQTFKAAGGSNPFSAMADRLSDFLLPGEWLVMYMLIGSGEFGYTYCGDVLGAEHGDKIYDCSQVDYSIVL